MIHPRDKRANNPRLQCDACGRWMRLHRKSEHPAHPGWTQNFYGSCSYTRGDHAAGNEVCVDCCDAKCKGVSQ
jgi:hypothetical protein